MDALLAVGCGWGEADSLTFAQAWRLVRARRRETILTAGIIAMQVRHVEATGRVLSAEMLMESGPDSFKVDEAQLQLEAEVIARANAAAKAAHAAAQEAAGDRD